MKRVIVCGGRDYMELENVWAVLERLHAKGEFMLIEGDQVGVDRIARQWALNGAHPCCNVPAHWHTLEKKAGAIRNAWMLGLEPHMVIAFPGGIGTADMIGKALAAQVETYCVSDKGEVTRRR